MINPLSFVIIIFEKVKLVLFGKRLKYNDAFQFCDQFKGQICILANSDIYFDSTLYYLYSIDMTAKMISLTRYDILKNGQIIFNDYMARACQDSWIFESPVPYNSMNIAFELGKPGCDNRIAYEFKSIGWMVINPSKKIITRHIHSTQKRNYNKEADTIKGNYALALPSDKFTEDKNPRTPHV